MSNQVLGTDTILRINDFTLLGLVQSEDWQPNFNTQDIMEMGNQARVDSSMELETSGSFEIMSSGNLAGLLARMAVKRNAGTGAFEGFLYDAAGAAGKNDYTITQSDMKELEFDLVMHQRSKQLEFDRSVWLPRCTVSGFSGRIDANGMGSESVQWMGQDVSTFPSPYHSIRAINAAYTSTTTFTLSDAAVTSATHELVYVYINESRFRNGTTSDATKFSLGLAGVITMTTTEGYVIPPTAKIMVLVYDNTIPTTTFPQLALADRGTSARYIKAYQANIYIAPVMVGDVPTLASSDLWLKAQSADFNVDTRLETLRQIKQNRAGTSIYSRVPTFPLTTTVNVSTFESDLADWKKLLTKSGVGVYNEALDWAPENIKETFGVVFEYFTKAGVKLQQVTFPDLRIDGATNRNNVGGRGEISWSLKGTKFTVDGTNG